MMHSLIIPTGVLFSPPAHSAAVATDQNVGAAITDDMID